MRFFLPQKRVGGNLAVVLRRAGYFGIIDRKNGKSSFTKPLSRLSHYPRFHLYIEENGENLIFNLHLDQKQVSYEGETAHSADYEDSGVRAEAERLNIILQTKV